MERAESAPVFVVGSPRSGTTLLYHSLLSAGGFAVYHAESRAYDLIGPRFGHFRSSPDRENFLDVWTRGYMFDRSGLDESTFRSRFMAECRSTGDFLRLLMMSISDAQGATRWAECTPTHLLYMPEIARDFPHARFVHVIRDGRDVALSMARQGWIRPLPLDTAVPEVVAALYWEWMVRRGVRAGRMLGDRYSEVHFEQLVENPRHVFKSLGSFLSHDLDYERIQAQAVGSVSKPNSSFLREPFSPVERWRNAPQSLQRQLARHVGGFLERLGYQVGDAVAKGDIRADSRRAAYEAWFEIKHRLRGVDSLARRRISVDELSAAVPGVTGADGAR